MKIFNKTNKTTFTNNAIPMEKNNYICIPAIDIDSVLKIDERLYPQAYLEQCKYKLKKRKIVNYINDEIIDENSDSDIDDASSVIWLKYNDRKIRAKCNFATLKNFMTC